MYSPLLLLNSSISILFKIFLKSIFTLPPVLFILGLSAFVPREEFREVSEVLMNVLDSTILSDCRKYQTKNNRLLSS